MRFAERFAEWMGCAFPLPLPADYQVIVADRADEQLIGSPAADAAPLLLQADIGRLDELPLGYFLTGFWGHGANSYAFYFCEVDEARRVFFRLPYGGIYDDVARQRRAVVAFLSGYAELRRRDDVVKLRAVDSMGEARYDLELKGGGRRAHAESLYGSADFDVLFRV
jgi:hypothetical protein